MWYVSHLCLVMQVHAHVWHVYRSWKLMSDVFDGFSTYMEIEMLT